MTGTIVIREIDAHGVPLLVYGEEYNAVLYLDATSWRPTQLMQELFEDGTRNEILAYYPTMNPKEVRFLLLEDADVWYADLKEQANA